MEKLIDIIIPAYKAQKTIIKTLSSIVSQSIVELCKITIVNDADGIGYGEIVKDFSKYLDVQELTLKENSGPGVARQVGIDNTNLPYLIFADADDTFYGAFAIEMLLDCIQQYPKTAMVRAKHYLETRNPNLKFAIYTPNFTWMFGKIFRREFINKNNIRFSIYRSNEDVAFNQQIHFLATLQEETPVDLDEFVYLWHSNPNSITRSDKDFVFSINLISYIDNLIYAIKQCTHRKGIENKHVLLKTSIKLMADLYIYYEEILMARPQYQEENFKACLKYYKEIYEIIEITQSSSFIEGLIIEQMNFQKERLSRLLPSQTFKQFLEKIRSCANSEEN